MSELLEITENICNSKSDNNCNNTTTNNSSNNDSEIPRSKNTHQASP